MTGIILETDRLQLRRLTGLDTEALYRILGDYDTVRGWPRAYTLPRVVVSLRRFVEHQARHGYSIWAVVRRDTGEQIGHCGLVSRKIGGWPVPELAYAIHRDHWGHGYATEAAAACRDYAFDRLRATRLIARIMYENHASRRVAERIGMRPAGGTSWLEPN